MVEERWGRVKELFQAAVERPADERARFLADACGEDVSLRAEVERLLTAHEGAGSFIEHPPNLTGTVIGRYEIGQLVGAGGMGEVYAAKDVSLGRKVAIKFARGGDPESDGRLRREAQHASRLNHPNICTIHEVGSYGDRPFIVMELVDGRRLSDVVAPAGLTTDEVAAYGMQIADALTHAHRNGVVHRDLKSANVVITPDRRVKVLDFGVARVLSRDKVKDLSESPASITDDRATAGTLSVMAPEVLRGEGADQRSDIWSLGVLLYEMTTGRRPFQGATGFELSAAILHKEPLPVADAVPDQLARVIHECLRKDPAIRYQRADDVRNALAEVLAKPRTRRRRSGSRSSPKPSVLDQLPAVSLTAVLAVAGVIVASIAAYATWRAFEGPVAIGASGRPAIAVMHFQHSGNHGPQAAWLSSGVPSMVATGLAQTEGLEIVSERRLLEALRQHGKSSFEGLNRTDAAEVARRAGAGAIVVGTIFHSGNEIRIDAQMEDLTTGRVIGAETVRGTDVFSLADQLAADIRQVVGFGSARGVRTVSDVSSTSLEAYRLYTEAIDAQTNARRADAVKRLESAVTIDPRFGEAYLRLAIVNGSLGNMNERRKYLNEAATLSSRLSERHRLLLELHIARDREDNETVTRTLNELLEKYPDMEEAYSVATHIYRPAYGPAAYKDRLLAITRAGVTTMPFAMSTRNNYGYALLDAGMWKEAIAQFEEYGRIAPREPNPHDSKAEAYLRMGDPYHALESYSSALAVDKTFAPSHTGRAWTLAVLGRYDDATAETIDVPHMKAMIFSRAGRYREAMEIVTAGEADATAVGDYARAGGTALVAAILALERQDHNAALKLVESANGSFARQRGQLQRLSLSVSGLLAGLAHMAAGRTTDAPAILEMLRRNQNDAVEIENVWRRLLEAEIALNRGNLGSAETSFTAATPQPRIFDPLTILASTLLNVLPSRDGLARVAAARGNLAEAIDRYRALLAYGPDSHWVAPYEPLYVLKMARLLEKKGDRIDALAEYDRFLSLWKNADPDLPELAEARQALVRLK